MAKISEQKMFSVIIPNWNGKHFLGSCLYALERQTYRNLEVIVADNASDDGSQDFIRQNYPSVKLIQLPDNRGFTGACNAGIEASEGAYAALLNNDTEVDSNWVAAVVRAFEQHPEVGIVASKMLLYEKRDHLHTAGDYFTVDGRAGNRGVWEKDEGQYDHEEYVFSACGGSSAYRRTMLERIGFLDDDFFFSMEDVDLAWRAQLAGWRCLYTPEAIVYHHLAATGGDITASYFDGRNSIFVLAKNYPIELWRQYRWLILKAQFHQAIQALRNWRGKAARARLKGMLAGVRGIPRMMRKRKRIQAARTVSIADLADILSSSGSGRRGS